MNASRALDVLITEKVMGWTWNALGDAWEGVGMQWVGCNRWAPSEILGDAWEVIEHVYKTHSAWMSVGINPEFLRSSRRNGAYLASIHGGDFAYKSSALNHYAYADTPALAVCRCICEVLNIEVNDVHERC